MYRSDKQLCFHVIGRVRWKLFTGLLIIFMPAAFLLLNFASEGLPGWTLLVPIVVLVILIIAGVKREGRRTSPPVPPRPPGEYEEPATEVNVHLEQAEQHAA